MSDTSVLAAEPNRRHQAGYDRRILHRGDDGRRSGDSAPTSNTLPLAAPDVARSETSPVKYLLTVGALFLLLWGGIIYANLRLNPLVYSASAQAEVAKAFVAGDNYGVFDLNIDMRGLRREHIKRLPAAPQVAVIGASHWQEGVTSLLPDRDFYNAHVHRDYYEDILSVTEMFLSSNRLPRQLIISIRDLTFTAPSARTDYLWLTGLPEYRSMARRLGIEPHSWLDVLFVRPWLDVTSLPAAWDRAVRWLQAGEKPGPTKRIVAPTLDILHAGGFITWSGEHDAMFTRQRAIDEALKEFAFFERRRIEIDPEAVLAVDRLLGLLRRRGVDVVLVHPPFNPVFYENLAATPYGDDMQRVVELTAALADRHGIPVIGSFDPTAVGCDLSMFIDSQHSRPVCLAKVLAQLPAAPATD